MHYQVVANNSWWILTVNCRSFATLEALCLLQSWPYAWYGQLFLTSSPMGIISIKGTIHLVL